MCCRSPRAVVFNQCAARIFKAWNTWLLSPEYWPLFSEAVKLKNDNSHHNNSHLMQMNQNYTFFCQIDKKPNILLVYCRILVISLWAPRDERSWKSPSECIIGKGNKTEPLTWEIVTACICLSQLASKMLPLSSPIFPHGLAGWDCVVSNRWAFFILESIKWELIRFIFRRCKVLTEICKR